MPRPRNNTEMRPSTPARKRCPFFEGWALFVGLAFGSPPAPALRDTYHLDPVLRALLDILLTEEGPVRTIVPRLMRSVCGSKIE